MSGRLLRLSVAGKRLGDVTPNTVRAWIRRGKIVGIKTPGGHWRVPEEEVERCLQNKTHRDLAIHVVTH
jgi:excisionase family DNA binding protein